MYLSVLKYLSSLHLFAAHRSTRLLKKNVPLTCFIFTHNRLTRSHLAWLVYRRCGIELCRPLVTKPEAPSDPDHSGVWKDQLMHPTS